MNLTELQRLVLNGESEKVEFKRSTGQRTEAMKSVCGMLNGVGGFVLFGVTDKAEITGQETSSRTLEDIAHELQRIEPPAFPDIEMVKLRTGKAVVVLRVSGGGGPYTYDGRPYARHGPTTKLMPSARYQRVLLERMHASQRWENLSADGFSIKDLDRAEILRTVDEAVRRLRLDDPGTTDIGELLTGFGLIKKDRLLNAAVVLFARSERLLPYYPQCGIRLARFRGTDKTEFLDNRQELGNAFELLTRTQRFFRDHLPVAGRILTNVFERKDDPLYPPAALREAVANALCHRDYSVPGGAVSVAIYDDRIEVSSTGVLPFDLTPEDLTRPHASRPWNPLIAQVFYRRGIIEAWGRGTIKMRELMEAAGLPAPEFESRAGEVVVRFHPAPGTGHTTKGERKSQPESQPESRPESQPESLELRILTLLVDGPLSKSSISERLGQKEVSGRLNMVMRSLLREGLVDYTIPERPNSRLQRYVLTPAGHARQTNRKA